MTPTPQDRAVAVEMPRRDAEAARAILNSLAKHTAAQGHDDPQRTLRLTAKRVAYYFERALEGRS